MRRSILLFLALVLFNEFVIAQVVLNGVYGYSIEPLVEWKFSDAISSKERMVFMSPEADMHLVITVSSLGEGGLLERYETATEGIVHSSLIELEEFVFNQSPALLGLIKLNNADNDIVAYSFFTSNGQYNYHLLFIAEESVVEANLPTVFSVLDSFALTAMGVTRGPISQFDYQINSNQSSRSINFNGTSIEVVADLEQFDAAQRVVEREAFIMSQHKVKNELAYLAWIRYYRAVYRDNYERIRPIYESIRERLPVDDLEVARLLLKYAQDYQYSRLDHPSDLNAPIAALLDKKGDCDSMALAYIILLNYHGINSALFLSQKLAHAVAGVEVRGSGFRLEALSESFIVAELTTKDDLGSVPLAVATNTDWFPLFFRAS